MIDDRMLEADQNSIRRNCWSRSINTLYRSTSRIEPCWLRLRLLVTEGLDPATDAETFQV